ncbi:MAG: hypothetical protein LBC13_00060 [Clostridiales bacterium]|jgi:cytochrome c|nr:hypothetical protein [Clostridiales bacterium]
MQLEIIHLLSGDKRALFVFVETAPVFPKYPHTEAKIKVLFALGLINFRKLRFGIKRPLGMQLEIIHLLSGDKRALFVFVKTAPVFPKYPHTEAKIKVLFAL